MCIEKQEAEPGFSEIKPDNCPMLIMLSRMTADAFLELDFDGDEEVEMNRQQCYEMLMDMYKGDMSEGAVKILKAFFSHFGCEQILRELAFLAEAKAESEETEGTEGTENTPETKAETVSAETDEKENTQDTEEDRESEVQSYGRFRF